ncbi:MAG: hypothetical protein DHS20C15_33390 [Planctomycetota bacterium]|nr:MAG: hypothetical protein DHS20C15_33390 [Planctomycetota bacterium]
MKLSSKLCRALACAVLVALVAVSWIAPPFADSGRARFLKQQSSLAKAAMRKRDWDAARSAWERVREYEPNSLDALDGLIEIAREAEHVDAEALYLRVERDLLEKLVAAGEGDYLKQLTDVTERLEEIDPRYEEGAVLQDAWARELAELAVAYEQDGLLANALYAAVLHLDIVDPTSEAAAATRALAERCLANGPDWLGLSGVVPDLSAGDRTEEWIEAHDKRTAKWSKGTKWETPHYRIKTNGGWRLGQAAAQTLEQVHAFYREIWGIVPDPLPPGGAPEGLRKVTVPTIDINIYGDHSEYIKRSGAPEWSGGVFKGSEVATYNHGQGGGGSWRATLGTLFHEASHQFMSVAVGNAPSFINEGVASLFEGIEILPNGSIRRDLPVPGRLTPLANGLRDGSAPSLRDVMAGANADTNEPKFYAPRWGYVYYLRMATDQSGEYVFRPRFADYLAEFKRGAIGDTTGHLQEFFEDEFEAMGFEDFDDFEAAWREWILALDDEAKNGDKRLEQYLKDARLEGLKKNHESALRLYERALDIDASEPRAIAGAGVAAVELEDTDRAVFLAHRLISLIDEEEPEAQTALANLREIDPLFERRRKARVDFVGGMAGLAINYDRDGNPLLAMATAREALAVDAFDASARSLVERLERETGKSVISWRRLFNGFDLDGWYTADKPNPFFADDGELFSDYTRVIEKGDSGGEAADISLYSTLFLDRNVRGDWTLEATLRADDDWEIIGLCFGAKASDDFEAIVLRRTGPKQHNVDFGSFDGTWSFRGDGSFKATYDPTSEDGVKLHIEVRDRRVSVTIDGEPVKPVVGGKYVPGIEYPRAALRGDVGLLASRGVSRFGELRLLAGGNR